MKFSEIWYIDASKQKKCYKKTFFGFWPVLDVFLTKKQQKLTKNEENQQNPNCLMKFSEIWYVDVSQQNKMLQKNSFWISAFIGRFSTKKQQKNSKKQQKKLAKSKLFDEIF